MRILALLVGLVMCAVTACGTSSSDTSSDGSPCKVVGRQNLQADDPLCIDLEEFGPSRRNAVIDGHSVTYWNYDGPSVAWVPQGIEGVAWAPGDIQAAIKKYPHVHVEVHRYADGHDTVSIEASEKCPVEEWDTREVNLGCSRFPLMYFQMIERSDAAVLLSEAMVNGLEADAEFQGGDVVIYAFFVVTPDPIRPDGHPYAG